MYPAAGFSVGFQVLGWISLLLKLRAKFVRVILCLVFQMHVQNLMRPVEYSRDPGRLTWIWALAEPGFSQDYGTPLALMHASFSSWINWFRDLKGSCGCSWVAEQQAKLNGMGANSVGQIYGAILPCSTGGHIAQWITINWRMKMRISADSAHIHLLKSSAWRMNWSPIKRKRGCSASNWNESADFEM